MIADTRWVVRIRVRRAFVMVAILSMVAINLSLCRSINEDGIDVRISILGDKEIEKDGRKVFVAGVWNWINITLEERAERIGLELYRGDTKPSIRGEQNYYAWEYDGEWKTLTPYNGRDYLDEKNCTADGRNFSFRVTVEDFLSSLNLSYENWTLSISYDGGETTLPIRMEQPITGLGVSGADFNLKVEPFQATVIYGDHTFQTINKGNLPILINISYDRYQDRITTSNTGKIIYPGESLEHSIEIRAPSWRPGIVEIMGSIEGTVPDFLIPVFNETQPTIRLQPIPVTPSFIRIYVGHAGCVIREMENITFQHPESIEIFLNETKVISSYLCGEGNLTVSLEARNLSLIHVWVDDNEIDNPENITIISSPDRETEIKVEIKPIQNHTEGYLAYTIRYGEETHRYVTKVIIKEWKGNVQETAQEGKQENIFPKILLIIAILIFILYLSFSLVRGRR